MTGSSVDALGSTSPAAWLEHWADERPNAVWINTGTQRLTFGDAHRMAGQFATYLHSLDLRPGQVVALDVPVTLHAILTVALFRLGILSCAYPRLVVADAFHCDWLISTFVTESPIAEHTLYLGSHNISLIDGLQPSTTAVGFGGGEPFRLIFSSGTTGRPKAIAVSTNLMHARALQSLRTRPAGLSYFSAMDVSTTAGLRTLLWCLTEGSTYLAPSDGSTNLALMKNHSVDVALMSPDQMRALLVAAEDSGEHLEALRSVVYAGSALDVAMAQRFRKWFTVTLTTSLGSTEGGIITVRTYDTDEPQDVGVVVDDLELEVVDEDDQPVPSGTVGRIRYRRSGDPTEYFRDPEATARVFRDGWCYPGDLGSMTSERQLFLYGRVDELANIGGIKIDPAHFDAVARDVIGVTDAAGFTFTDLDGQLVAAVAVVTTFGFDDQELLDALAHAFGARQPSTVVKVDELPKTAMGKVIRSELTRRVEAALRSS